MRTLVFGEPPVPAGGLTRQPEASAAVDEQDRMIIGEGREERRRTAPANRWAPLNQEVSCNSAVGNKTPNRMAEA